MKKLLFIMSISLLIAFTFSSCNKDIPKDIPDWLKTKIIEIKKDIKDKTKNGGGPSEKRYIVERSNGQSIIYEYFTGWRVAGLGGYYEVYNKEGQELCGYYGALLSGQCNDTLSINDIAVTYSKTKTIWLQK